MGESALDERFLDVMRDALHDVLHDDVMIPLDATSKLKEKLINPTFAAARGTAEFAKRLMESPDGCVEIRLRRWWRRHFG